MASIINQCSAEPVAQLNDIEIRIERDYKNDETFLVAPVSIFECSQVTLFAPEGQSYLLNFEEEGALRDGDYYKFKIEASLSTDPQKWSKLSQFFDTAGQYKTQVEQYNGQLIDSQFEWQFPECNFLTNRFENWAEELKKYGGTLKKTKLGYQKTITGKGFSTFTIMMSACSSFGMGIKISGLSREYKEQALETIIDILSLYDKEFIEINTNKIKLLGSESTDIYLESTSHDVLEASSQVQNDFITISIGISFN